MTSPASKLMIAKLTEIASRDLNYAEAAKEIGCGYHYVASFAGRHGIAFTFAKRGRPVSDNPPDARCEDMRALFQGGQTLEQIGQKYKITRERVRQILKKHYGFNKLSGGQCETARKNRRDFMKKRDARMIRHWGCTYKQYQSILKHRDKPTLAFASQRQNAAKRDIGWELTLWQWWKIWQHSGHWADRGRGKGYGMCRLNDVGPYSIDNVYIATGVENMQDYWVNRRAASLEVAAQ